MKLVNKKILKTSIQMVKKGDMDKYAKFESKLILQLNEYYGRKSKEWINSSSINDYVKNVSDCIQLEKTTIKDIIGVDQTIEDATHQLIEVHKDKILNDKEYGIAYKHIEIGEDIQYRMVVCLYFVRDCVEIVNFSQY